MENTRISIRLIQENERNRWDEYVKALPEGTCYHLSGWKDLIEKTFGHKTYYLLAERIYDDKVTNSTDCSAVAPQHGSTAANTNLSQSSSTAFLPPVSKKDPSNSMNPMNPSNSSSPTNPSNRIVGILPLVHLKTLIFGSLIVSLPYFSYGGVCGESYEIQDLLLNEAIKIAEKKNAESIELRHTTNVFNSLPTKTAKVSMRLDLPQNPDELWHSFSSNLRRKIRKPTKEGFSWQYGREGELDNFYTVFSRNMRDLGTPVYSKGFFRNILQEFPDSTWIGTVKTKGGRPIASAFLVGFRDRLEIPWVSSLRSYNRHYANLFLYWNMLKFASESGYKVFDFGRSTLGEGTYKFKEQWGAKPVQLYWHYWAKNGRPLQQLNPKNPKYRLAIYIWKKLPVSLTKLIGPEIRKYIWL